MQVIPGHGNDATMQSMENDEAVSRPSHSRLEDAGKARVSHIPTTTTTRLIKKRQAAVTASLEAQRGSNLVWVLAAARREPYSSSSVNGVTTAHVKTAR